MRIPKRSTLSSFYLLFILGAVFGYPIDVEDAADLLPDIPRTKNETVAALVQDPVVQDAVQSVLGDGPLSGLVVRKSVVIIPANDPETVLSQQHQVLTAPISHLEDIRKNITDAGQAEQEENSTDEEAVSEVDVSEVIASDENEASSSTKNKKESYPENKGTSVQKVRNDNRVPPNFTGVKVPGIEQTGILLPGTVPQKLELPNIIDERISVPIVAILDQSKLRDTSGVEGSLVALLPRPSDQTTSGLVEKYAENHSKIKEEVKQYLSPAVEENKEPLHPAVEVEVKYNSHLQNLDVKESEDMAVAEDIVFRPLFRFRQEQRRRSSVLGYSTYNRRQYNSYYDSYSRRKYRDDSQYSNKID
ncbi:uncharacterized protein LOC107264892 [Cephus cinctus]|uniref:Uncharacterized protein LOC107264892 n=1 Tax=Cephus cinctus TaxID=211228 RepID=A0AAJ7FFF4_CEPCN|nr:uncharacterized protein LOC107264892 [Cephus cinctus]